jgi:anti-anti-sigma regulatory factor
VTVDSGLLGRLIPGDHVCWLVDDQDIRADGTAVYVRAGLVREHKVVYHGDDPDGVIAGLEARGVHTDAAISSGQLQVSTAESTYLSSGVFDPEATIRGWRRESALARKQGYRGLRALGDMSWASRAVPGADRLPWYEAQVNRIFADGYAMGICLYDRRLFAPAALQGFTASHPGLISPETGAGQMPLLHVVRTTAPPGLRLDGEADLSNRRALRAVIDHLLDDLGATGRALTIDVSELRFADGETARTMVRAASRSRGLRIVGCSGSMARLLAFHGADTTPGLTVETAP